MSYGKEKFKQAQEEQIKNIVREIKTQYFNFLSSLKYENFNEKKMEDDFKTSSNQQTEELPFISPSDLQNTKEEHLCFEEELATENSGYAAYINLTQKIKELKSFNSNLKYQIIANAPKPPKADI